MEAVLDDALAVGFVDAVEGGPADVSLSRALVLERTGLIVFSPSLLRGESRPDLLPLELPDNESPDRTLPEFERDPRAGPVETRGLGGRVNPLAPLPVDEVDGCLLGPAAGKAGGPIEVLLPPTEGRVLAPMDDTRVFEGVPVREIVPAVPSCLVGDLVGD